MSRLAAAASLLSLLAFAAPARAADGRPFQLSLFPPAQIVPEGESVSGLRLALLYGKNASVTGVDLGLATHATGSFTGFQWSLVGLVDGNLTGWQNGWAVNVTGGTMTGFQWGIFNKARRVEGLQLGFVNMAGTIRGLQVGLVNVVERGGWLPVMVIANGNFD